MSKERSQNPSIENDERQTVINGATQAANWCLQILRVFLVVADAPAGTDESLTCRAAVFENVKGCGFQQQLAEPLWKAAEYVSSESNRKAVSHYDGEPDRSLIASIDAWSNSWHDLASHVLTDLAENASRILNRDVVIDYRDASEEDLNYFKLTMYGWRIPEDWFDVLFFVKHQWRFRSIRLDQIENGILRENLRIRATGGTTAPHSSKPSEQQVAEVEKALAKLGIDAAAKNVIAEAGVNESAGRMVLRDLESQGRYRGFSRRRRSS